MAVHSNNSSSHNPYAYRAHYAIGKYAKANEVKVNERGLSLSATLSKMKESTTRPSKEHPVCIIGAGPAGLYAAMILESIGVPYRLLEASSRVGGRLFTHRFKRRPGEKINEYDYFDVGAMRFPDTPFMKRVFHLVRGDPKRGIEPKVDVKLIKYNIEDKGTFLYYNSYRYKRSETFAPDADPFHTKGLIPTSDLSPTAVRKCIEGILAHFRSPFADPKKPMEELISDLFEAADAFTMRSYLSVMLKIPGAAITYYETLQDSTGSYDRALTETVLHTLAFDWPKKEEKNPAEGSFGAGAGPFSSTTGAEEAGQWYCFDGGSSRLAEAMNATLEYPAETEQPVSKIAESEGGRLMDVHISGVKLEQQFSAVISTVPLPRLSTMDLSECSIHDNFVQWSAMRELQYGPSIKIGIRFARAWWQDGEKDLGFEGGQSSTDLPIRTTVYPSYPEGPNKSRVLIVSYCWTQDADRMGSLFRGDGTAAPELLDLVFANLAKLHGVEEAWIRSFYIDGDYFAWDWNRDPNTMGAFALFGPQQFEDLYPHMIQPAAHQKLFFAGEALSACHAWVAGAFDSSWRAVEQLLHVNKMDAEHKLFREQWGGSQYWDSPLMLPLTPAKRVPAPGQGPLPVGIAKAHEEGLEAPPPSAPHRSSSVVVEDSEQGTAMEKLLQIGFVLREEAANTRDRAGGSS